jgi:hypothetical protein
VQGVNKIKKIWDSIRSNPYWVSFEGGATGALSNYIEDLVTSGHRLDFSKTGLEKLGFFMLSGGYTAVKLLYRPQPVPTVVATVPPSTAIVDVPAKLTPLDPNAKKEQP